MTNLFVSVRSPDGIPSEVLQVEPIELLEKFCQGRDPQEFTESLKMAVCAGLFDQVKFWHGHNVDLNSEAYGASKLLIFAWGQGKEMFDRLFNLGARVSNQDAMAMGEEFNKAYQTALKTATFVGPTQPGTHPGVGRAKY